MTSVDKSERLVPDGTEIKDRWVVGAKLGAGGFGEIYVVTDKVQKKPMGLKVEAVSGQKQPVQVLKMEVTVLKKLQGKNNVCQFYACGRHNHFNYIVMTLLGENIAEKRRRTKAGYFSESTALRLGAQMLSAIEAIHDVGFLHRDIKPSNFAIGLGSEKKFDVFMIDFGLARQYKTPAGSIRPPRSVAGFRGTVRYASLAAHNSQEMGRQDDLWSYLYMMIELFTGDLPWRKFKEKDQVGQMKKSASATELTRRLPTEFSELARSISSLGYYDKPDYDKFNQFFVDMLIKRDIKRKDPFDWDIEKQEESSRPPHGEGYTTGAPVGGLTTVGQVGAASDFPESERVSSKRKGKNSMGRVSKEQSKTRKSSKR